ncbi:NAD(P)-dependent oxidoreductase [Actinocrispum wychmicini]|uniref:3-hydroxyisobutyrate dehydrogenase-like beta-hydroxyacid dehydrogenase n=1 Tax=Actinocrispum wychmicini TaxID=1213861 RepID=A0A4R2JEY2_9PSEU|nr:NAD(P)-binding domain-containing protein [Actinocrispum wychmicini]TCO58263.1 3-hydroxyisobutyrate dehydrogenase-like beta-hydroxyacid dehydrogenase [Actinocrispum wychmicini]
MVTVIGLGPMGQAMVRKFVAAGYPTTVWNRTAGRADGLGAAVAPSVADALAANRLVVLSLTDYQAMYDVLGGAELDGKVIVNLSSDTPARTRAAAKWLADRGAELIAGGVMVPAPLVGTEHAYIFYSGRADVYAVHSELLGHLGKAHYLGADHALAQLYYQAQLDIFLTSLSSYLHASALLKAAGVSAADFASFAVDNFNSLSMYVADAARNIDSGEHPGDLANVTMMGATADHIVGASRELGVDPRLPEAVQAQYERAVKDGHGKSSWTSLIEGLT